MPKLPLLALVFGTGLALVATTPGAASAAATLGCDDDSGLCVNSGGAKWSPDKTASAKDRRKRKAKTGGTLSVDIDGGRGSVFLNGRYVGTAPVSDVAIPQGKNDVHVRDGDITLATGVLNVPKGASVSLTVRHD
ncbi:MAG: hypothetical protein AAF799_13060 [Myxococcota bacterium]